MSSKKNKDVIVSSVIEKEKKSNLLVISLIIIIILLLLGFVYLLFFKKCPEKEQCDCVMYKEVEVEVEHQLINYQGLRFFMPLDWNFVSNDDSYQISNLDNNLLIVLNYVDIDFDSFISESYQKTYLEELQTSGNIKIEKKNTITKDDVVYYLMEGSKDSYTYMVVVVGNASKTVLVSVQFEDNISFNDNKENVINFAISSIKKGNE